MATRTIGTVLVALAMLAAGCVGSAVDSAGSSAALTKVPAAQWMHAPEGCEGRLQGVASFGAAEGVEGIVVALDMHGLALCADSLDAVTADLEEAGAPASAIELAVRGLGGLDHAIPLSYARDDRTKGDPSPQPSSPRRPGLTGSVPVIGGGVNLGDPSPQPSAPRRPGESNDDGHAEEQSAPAQGDPSPQPSTPSCTSSAPTGGDPSPQPSSPTAPASPSSPDVGV